MPIWGWFSISLLEIKKDKEEDEKVEEDLDEKINHLIIQEPIYEFIEGSIKEPKRESSGVIYLVIIVLIAAITALIEYLHAVLKIQFF